MERPQSCDGDLWAALSRECRYSVLTVMELQYGIVRADTDARAVLRQRFLAELLASIPVHPVTTATALRAGRIDAEERTRGVRIATADLLIGATALELGYGVATANVRHFRMIPGLEVILLS